MLVSARVPGGRRLPLPGQREALPRQVRDAARAFLARDLPAERPRPLRAPGYFQVGRAEVLPRGRPRGRPVTRLHPAGENFDRVERILLAVARKAPSPTANRTRWRTPKGYSKASASAKPARCFWLGIWSIHAP